MSLPEHSCINLSSGCLSPLINSHLWIALAPLPYPEALELPVHFHISMLKNLPLRQECKLFLGQAETAFISRPNRLSVRLSPLCPKRPSCPLEIRKWTTLTINYLARAKWEAQPFEEPVCRPFWFRAKPGTESTRGKQPAHYTHSTPFQVSLATKVCFHLLGMI